MSLIKFKKKNSRRAAACLAAGMMVLSAGAMFTGCNKDAGGSSSVSQEELMKSLAYKVEEIKLDYEISGNVTSKNGLYYFCTYDYELKDDNYFSNNDIVVIDSNGQTVLTIPVFHQTDPEVYGGINGELMIDDNGNIVCIVYTGGYDAATDTYNEKKDIVTYDSTGKEISRVNCESLYDEHDYNNPDEMNSYFSGIIMDGSGNIIINMSNYIQVCDSSGNKLFKTEKLGENGWISSLFLTNAGVPAICTYEYTNDEGISKIVEIDIAAKGFGKEYVTGGGNQMFSGSGDYLCYFTSSSGISGINAATLEYEPILNLLNLGIDNSNTGSFTVNDDGSFAVINTDYSKMTPEVSLAVIKPVDSSEIKEREAITLGCYYLDWNLRSYIADFNKTNEEYVINCTAYSDSNDTADYDAAMTNFHNELISGNIPDILLVDYSMPFDSYVSKGMFTDLYELMENDADISKDSFMPNVLEAIEKDGKLYEISPAFTVQTMAGKASVLGDSGNLTIAKADELTAALSPEANIFSNHLELSSGSILDYALGFGDFVDYKNGTCNFDSEGFKAVLEFAKRYPESIDYDKLYNENMNYWMDQEAAIRNNKALLTHVYLSDLGEYRRIKYGIIGEEAAFTGVPGCVTGENAGAAIISLNTEIAVSEKSKNKEGAWAFIKEVLLNTVEERPETIYDSTKGEYVETGKMVYSIRNYGLPVIKDQLDKIAAQAKIPNTYIDENGNVVEEEWSHWIGNEEIKLPNLSDADIDECMALINSANRLANNDEKLNEIIREEAAYYFNGTKSLDETTAMIQSRASIYMSEQY